MAAPFGALLDTHGNTARDVACNVRSVAIAASPSGKVMLWSTSADERVDESFASASSARSKASVRLFA
jgi:hypothetical protein